MSLMQKKKTLRRNSHLYHLCGPQLQPQLPPSPGITGKHKAWVSRKDPAIDNSIKEDFIRKGGANLTAVTVAPATGTSLLMPTLSITSGSSDEGSAGSGAEASTGDVSVGAAIVLEGALKKDEIEQDFFVGTIAFAAIARSCADGFLGSALVKCIHAWWLPAVCRKKCPQVHVLPATNSEPR